MLPLSWQSLKIKIFIKEIGSFIIVIIPWKHSQRPWHDSELLQSLILSRLVNLTAIGAREGSAEARWRDQSWIQSDTVMLPCRSLSPWLLTRPVRSLLCFPTAGKDVGTVSGIWLLESNFVVELPVTSSSSQTQSNANYPAQPAVLWKLCETFSAARPDSGCAFALDQTLRVRKLKVLFGDRGPHLRVAIV